MRLAAEGGPGSHPGRAALCRVQGLQGHRLPLALAEAGTFILHPAVQEELRLAVQGLQGHWLPLAGAAAGVLRGLQKLAAGTDMSALTLQQWWQLLEAGQELQIQVRCTPACLQTLFWSSCEPPAAAAQTVPDMIAPVSCHKGMELHLQSSCGMHV